LPEYKTILQCNNAEIIVKRSRFIGHAKQITTDVEASAFIDAIKKEHSSATHNCTAFSVRNGNITRCNDDGEPHGTAGMPMLQLILKEQLTDICVVVTRYFGGTLLGTGGLAKAYTNAAKAAIEAASIITMMECAVCVCVCDYSFHGKLTYILSTENTLIGETLYEESVKINFITPIENYNYIKNKLTEASAGRFETTMLVSRWMEFNR